MINHIYTCRLLSDVIISSSSATEGFNPSLDYIPGSKFWGIVASKLYNMNDIPETLNIFHNGKVHFGDAHLVIGGKRSHIMPLSWFRDKHNKDSGIYIHHFIKDYKALTASGVQPQQMPNAYFVEGVGYTEPVQSFSIKSAYNTKLRRSEDEKMYGYYALPNESEWRFSVSSDSKELLEKIKTVLEENQRVGRSRSSQYGLVQITFKEEVMQSESKILPGIHYLYADSDIMLPVESKLSKVIPDIVFAKSKIRTRIYQSWNTHRNTRDADRQVIVKGSVLVVNLQSEISEADFLKPLQERRSEGFGEILIDPEFLTNVKDVHFYAKEMGKMEIQLRQQNSYANIHSKDDGLIALLNKRKEEHTLIKEIDLAVNSFIGKYKDKFRSVSSSQWGTVRNFAKLFKEEELKTKLVDTRIGYLRSGIAKSKWSAGISLIEEILNETDQPYPNPRHLFLEKLAAEMAKMK